jgi:hypothetical protein
VASVVADALKYQGAAYVFGGTPGPSGVGPWDCSSFANAVIGRDLGMAIPGYAAGDYHGQAHGPVVAQWASWSGAATLPTGQPPSAGDLCVWNGIGASGHMGIALASNQMISALDTEEGTRVTPIQGYGPIGAPLTYRRLLGVAGETVDLTSATTAGALSGALSGAGAELLLSLALGAAIPAAMVGAILLGAYLLGIAASGALLFAAAKTMENQ